MEAVINEAQALVNDIETNSSLDDITEESETGADLYKKMVAKYNIELSDDSDDDY